MHDRLFRPFAGFLIALALIAFTSEVRAQVGEVVQVALRPDRATVEPGGQVAIAVRLTIAEGWHINTQSPSVPAALEEAGWVAIPTTIKVTGVTGGKAGKVQWPKPDTISTDLAGDGTKVDLEVFEHTIHAFVPVIAAADASGSLTVTVSVGFQACKEQCLPPETNTYTLTIPVTTREAALPPSTDPPFNRFDPSGYATVGLDAEAPGASHTAAPKFFGIERPAGIVGLALLAMLGGLILNLTPCVLPVIPIKIMTISQHASTPGKGLYLGLWMAAGVVAFWIAIGLPVVLVSSFGDASRVFGIWWVTFGIGVLIAAMALGLMGLFTFNLPQGLYMINPKADTAWGSFAYGVMTAVLGLPCFGFVAGALLVGSATMPKVTVLTIFACLGVGMASPYLVLSARPGWVAKMPRTGPASDLVKQVMGLLLLAAAAYFAGSGLIGLVAEHPYLGRQLHVWAVALCAVAAAGWLIVRTFQITARGLNRVSMAVVAIVIAGGAVWYATDSTVRARENHVSKSWRDFDPVAFDIARRDRIVVVDFTAEWCLICKSLKATVLSTDAVKEAFKGDDIVLFTADLTAESAPGWKKLGELGRTGIPLLAIYTPGVEEPWLHNAYTREMVVDAIRTARDRSGGGGSGPR